VWFLFQELGHWVKAFCWNLWGLGRSFWVSFSSWVVFGVGRLEKVDWVISLDIRFGFLHRSASLELGVIL
jgi:hypothetical protein